MASNTSPHIVLIPSPGIGHLTPLGEFSKQVVLSHGLTATFVIPTNAPVSVAQKHFFEALPEGIDYAVLPPANIDDLLDVRVETRISVTMVRSMEHIRAVIKSIKDTTRLVAIVVDLFGTDTFEVAKELSISTYIFFPSAAMSLSTFLYLPNLDESTSCEYRDLPDPVQIPGCIPFKGSDLLLPVQDRKNEAYKWILHHAKRYSLAEGIMVNSFRELEPGPIRAMMEGGLGNPPIYPVGPLVKMGHNQERLDKTSCLEWLDGQPKESVLYISFGSTGVLSPKQITELALGLELSKHKFLWVFKSPNAKSSKDPLAYLPKGFLERIEGAGVGLVLPSWVPQAEILSHGSTGGFLTHGGWNSTLESMVNGVPLIVWPLYAEQKMNAVMLAEDVKVALRPKFSQNRLVERHEIARVVYGLMEGEEGKQLRSRMIELKIASEKTLRPDGNSTKILSGLTQKWITKASL